MIVALAGAHGKVALRLTALLRRAGDEVIGLIRNPDHAADVERQGGSPVVCDLEQATVEEITAAIAGADAAVFAAGAGPGSGAEQLTCHARRTVTRGGLSRAEDCHARRT